jgi:hypothetical protein
MLLLQKQKNILATLWRCPKMNYLCSYSQQPTTPGHYMCCSGRNIKEEFVEGGQQGFLLWMKWVK